MLDHVVNRTYTDETTGAKMENVTYGLGTGFYETTFNRELYKTAPGGIKAGGMAAMRYNFPEGWMTNWNHIKAGQPMRVLKIYSNKRNKVVVFENGLSLGANLVVKA